MRTIGWVTGTTDLTDPAVATAVAESGAGPVDALTLAPVQGVTPVGVGVSGAVRVVISAAQDEQLTVSANVDDLDPRVWPGVLSALLAAGAHDAWLTPIVMKKGRPAHTVTALVSGDGLAAVRAVLLTETTSIGMRVQRVEKLALTRSEAVVEIDGVPVRVKIAVGDDGEVFNVMPEWDDVAAAAATLGRPARRVLTEAHAAAAALWQPGP